MIITTIPPEAFRLLLRPHEPTDGYWSVCLLDTVEQVRSALRDFGYKFVDSVIASSVEATVEELPDLRGFLLLPMDQFGAGLLAHELAHIAFRSMNQRGIEVRHWETPRQGFATYNEEVFCKMLGRLTVQFWREYYGRGFDRGRETKADGVDAHGTTSGTSSQTA